MYEKSRYVELNHNINLIAYSLTKLKELISAKKDPTPKDELAGVYSISFRTDFIFIHLCIRLQ